MASRANKVARLFQAPQQSEIVVVACKPSGDCFFECCSLVSESRSKLAGFSEDTSPARGHFAKGSKFAQRLDIAQLRNVVADALTEANLADWLSFHAAGVEGYEFMASVSSLDQLRQGTRLRPVRFKLLTLKFALQP